MVLQLHPVLHRLVLGQAAGDLKDGVGVGIQILVHRAHELSLLQGLHALGGGVDPHQLDLPGDPGPLHGVQGSQGHLVVVADHQLDLVGVLLQPLLHEGGGLVSVPVGDAAGELLDGNSPVLQGLDRPLCAD